MQVASTPRLAARAIPSTPSLSCIYGPGDSNTMTASGSCQLEGSVMSLPNTPGSTTLTALDSIGGSM